MTPKSTALVIFSGCILSCSSDVQVRGTFSERQDFSVCGDNVRNSNEECDGTDVAPSCAELGFDQGSVGCSANCTLDISQCTAFASCGNGSLDPNEQCDTDDGGNIFIDPMGMEVRDLSCAAVGNYVAGTFGCSPQCVRDATTCIEAECGDGIKNGGEVCDGSDLQGVTCETIGPFSGGGLRCAPDCQNFDTARCEAAPEG